VGLSALLGCGVLAVEAVPVGTASAYPYPDVSITGQGWGNAYGMGQWGAFGYSLAGWSYTQILQHFYGQLAAGGSTTVGSLTPAQDATIISVVLTEDDGGPATITSQSPFSVGSQNFSAGQTVRLTPNASGNTWDVYPSSSGSGCTAVFDGAPLQSNVTNPVVSPGVAETWPSDPSLAGQVLEVCVGGQLEGYRGSIEGTFNSADQARTMSLLPLEQYISDVTPSESPSYWGSLGSAGAQGEHQGFQELEAQAVAARSYVMSDLNGYGGYADTCDSDCQSYPGITYENATTTQAVEDTLGVVVFMPNGSVATTQYSSSDGGETIRSTFSAVQDLGDSVCVAEACNSHHLWTAQVPVSAVESEFPSIGVLESVQVTQRDGVGSYGGRVLQMSVVGSTGSVSLSGSNFATDFYSYGVQSYWFEVSSQPSGGMGGYWMTASDGGVFSFGNASFYGSMGGKPLNAPIVGMATTQDDKGYWLVASDGGIFSFGDAHFYGSMGGKHLNAPIVGMAAMPNGAGYWLVASDGGIFSFGGAGFHGSMGAKPLNKPVVSMASTPNGLGYWLVASDGGIFSFGDAHFYGSTGSMRLNAPIEGMASAPGGTGYWLVAQDGGIFSFGTAQFEGSLPSLGIDEDTANGILPTATGGGYLIVCRDGTADDTGDAPQFGDVQSAVPGFSGTIVAAASTPG
jgi:SpoIID/LytB domain protein